MTGRGRLTEIEKLPPTADEDIAWAKSALTARKLTQQQIYSQFAQRLDAKGISAMTISSFNRWTISYMSSLTGGPDLLSKETRRLLAVALRAVVADLENSLDGDKEHNKVSS